MRPVKHPWSTQSPRPTFCRLDVRPPRELESACEPSSSRQPATCSLVKTWRTFVANDRFRAVRISPTADHGLVGDDVTACLGVPVSGTVAALRSAYSRYSHLPRPSGCIGRLY